jgi:uncharacterized damage-inducible protein DinB
MWSTSSVPLKAIRVFGALLALEVVTGLEGLCRCRGPTSRPLGRAHDPHCLLDYVCATVHAKCEHLAEVDARRAPLSTSPLMTLAGLVNHLRWVEYFWFQVMLLGEDDHSPWTEGDPDREMRIAVEVPIIQLIGEYQAWCARYRDLVACLDLDTPSKRTVSGRPVTLRWILFHLVEETAWPQRAPRHPPRAGRRRDRYLTGRRRQGLRDPLLDKGPSPGDTTQP